MWLWAKLPNFLSPLFAYTWNRVEKKGISVIRMFVKLNGLICVKCLEQCLGYCLCYITIFLSLTKCIPPSGRSESVWTTFFPSPAVTTVAEVTVKAEEDLCCSPKALHTLLALSLSLAPGHGSSSAVLHYLFRVGQSRLTLWIRETQFILESLCINYCSIFHTNSCKPHPWVLSTTDS